MKSCLYKIAHNSTELVLDGYFRTPKISEILENVVRG